MLASFLNQVHIDKYPVLHVVPTRKVGKLVSPSIRGLLSAIFDILSLYLAKLTDLSRSGSSEVLAFINHSLFKECLPGFLLIRLIIIGAVTSG